ncbi:MAG: hypothetical protein Aurels2KO_09150 [Aureliella sp.]
MFRHILTAGLLAIAMFGSPPETLAFDDWTQSVDEATGVTLITMDVRIHPAKEANPALSINFIPGDHERLDGNSAVHYLKALGFFEQTFARQKLTEYHQAESKRVQDGEIESDAVRPYIWLETPPAELPLEEVREFLSYTSFQPKILREAAKYRSFSGERNMAGTESPIMYLLPEIQSFREAARMQSLRCRLAITEDRVDDAVEIIGQQFAMANHLSQDIFFVSALVGCAIQGIANTDALYLAQHADTPNLYWAYASLPKPLIEMRQSYSFERNFLFEQIDALRDVDERPRPAGYWSDVIDRILPKLKDLEVEGVNITGGDVSLEAQRLALVTHLAGSYPGARDYLVEDLGMDAATVDAYPTVQTVLLAVCKVYLELRDAQFKLRHLDYPDVVRLDGFGKFQDLLRKRTDRIGAAAGIATALLPALHSIWAAENRCQLNIATAQTVESIRHYAATHDGALPKSLDQLELPAPKNPFTGELLEYEIIRGRGILQASSRNMRSRIILTVQN